MAVHSFAWIIPVSIGPLGAGLIMDNYDPRWIWFAAGLSGTIAVIGFLMLHFKAGSRFAEKQNGHKKALKGTQAS